MYPHAQAHRDISSVTQTLDGRGSLVTSAQWQERAASACILIIEIEER